MGRILTLPRTREVSLAAVTVEYTHQLVLTLWVGGLAVTASLAVPGLLESIPDPELAARSSLELLGHLSLLGCGAGSFLLLTSLLMHLLTLRSTRTILAQAALVLVMTAVAMGCELVVAPRLATLLRLHPELFRVTPPDVALGQFQKFLGIYLGAVLLQSFLGACLLLLGVRRWYRYVSHPVPAPWAE